MRFVAEALALGYIVLSYLLYRFPILAEPRYILWVVLWLGVLCGLYGALLEEYSERKR